MISPRVIAILVSGWLAGAAQAAFVDYRESFDGTEVDTSTWVPYHWGAGSASVSGGYLDLSGQYLLGTRWVTSSVGASISARVMLTAPSTSGAEIAFGFTDTPSQPLLGHHAYASLINSIQGESMFIFFAGSNNSANGTSVAMADNIGKWYALKIFRTASSSFECFVFDDSNALLHRNTYTFSGLPYNANLFVGLGPNARFDWVAIPEPASIGTILLVGAMSRCCRPHHLR